MPPSRNYLAPEPSGVRKRKGIKGKFGRGGVRMGERAETNEEAKLGHSVKAAKLSVLWPSLFLEGPFISHFALPFSPHTKPDELPFVFQDSHGYHLPYTRACKRTHMHSWISIVNILQIHSTQYSLLLHTDHIIFTTLFVYLLSTSNITSLRTGIPVHLWCSKTQFTAWPSEYFNMLTDIMNEYGR